MATWTKPADGQKTVTGCIVGKPLIIGHKALSKTDANGSWCMINTVSGAKMGMTQNSAYMIGTFDYRDAFDGAGNNTFIVVPTATSVVLQISGADNDDELYVYQ